MKVTVIKNLNVRTGKPSVNAPCYNYLTPGSVIEVEEQMVEGDFYEGNNKWYKGLDGNFYWSGGVNEINANKLFKMSENWHISKFGIDSLWNKTKGKGIRVAILDTGLMESHPDINKNNIVLTKNFLYEGEDELLMKNVSDNIGHGTHCAGIIAAQGIYSCGVAPDVSLLIGKISDKSTGIDSSLLFKGIEWAYTNNADVISVSVAVDQFNKEFQNRIQNLDSDYKGILVGSLTDLGDLGFDSNSFPTSLNACIGVGAVNKNYKMDEVTARSSYLDILGPGRDIFSIWNDGRYKTMTGCSMATPFVAGVIALILAYLVSQNKKISKKELINYLKTVTDKFDSFESLPEKKYPIIDPVKIFNLIN